jgi:hypothetical protein
LHWQLITIASYHYRNQIMGSMDPRNLQITPELRRVELSRRRDFMRRALLATAYVAPLVTSFAANDLVRAASWPGVGGGGKGGGGKGNGGKGGSGKGGGGNGESGNGGRGRR